MFSVPKSFIALMEGKSSPSSPRTAVSGAARQNSGPLANKFVVTGMTMKVANPYYESLSEQRRKLEDEFRLDEITKQRADIWVRDAKTMPITGMLINREIRERLENIDGNMIEARNLGLFIEKPPAVQEFRNMRFSRLVMDAANEYQPVLVAELQRTVRGQLFPGTIVLTEPQQQTLIISNNAIANVVSDVIGNFRDNATSVDYYEFPLTTEELRLVFREYLCDRIEEVEKEACKIVDEDGGPRLPFGAENGVDKEERTIYNAETIQVNAVPQMLPTDGAQATWFDEWMEDFVEARHPQTEAEKTNLKVMTASLRITMTRLVTGDGPSTKPRPPLLHVTMRGDMLRSDDTVKTTYKKTMLDVATLTAIIDQHMDRPPNLEGTDFATLRRDRANAMAKNDHTEEAFQAQRLRVAFEALNIVSSTEIRMRQIEYKLTSVAKMIDGPQVEERDMYSSNPVTFRAALVHVAGDPNPAPLAGPGIRYELKWFFQPSPVETVVDATPQPIEMTAEPVENTFSIRSFEFGKSAGKYRAEITRFGPGPDDVSVFHSDEGAIRVFAHCLRCPDYYEIGSGITNTFGECEWYEKLMNADRATYRKDMLADSSLGRMYAEFRMGMGGGNGLDYVEILDDSVVNKYTGMVIDDDAQLIGLSLLGIDGLRNEYFSYESIVANISDRFEAAFAAEYSENIKDAVFAQICDKTACNPFVGAIAAILNPPPANIVQTLDALFGNNNAKYTKFKQQILLPLTSAPAQEPNHAFNAAVSAVSRAKTLRDVPVSAVLAAIHHNGGALLYLFMTKSERRFMGEMTGRFSMFREEFINHFGPNSTTQLQYITETAARLLQTASITRANVRLAVMRATDIRQSPSVWNKYSKMGLTDMSGPTFMASHLFFIDIAAEERFSKRINGALLRTNTRNQTAERVALGAFNERESLDERLRVAEALGAPFDVPMSIWLQMGDVVKNGGSVSVARVARAIWMAGGPKTAHGMKDWRGVHSYIDSQPTPYTVTIGELAAISSRGSERLDRGYDFPGLHTRIISLIDKFNTTPTATLATEIQVLVRAFNVLSQFGQERGDRAFVTVEDIETRIVRLFT